MSNATGHMTRDVTSHGLGRVCPRCKEFTVIFSGVDVNGVHLLPVTGKFQYPCGKCGWSMECDTKLLESSRTQKSPKIKR